MGLYVMCKVRWTDLLLSRVGNGKMLNLVFGEKDEYKLEKRFGF